MFTTEPLSFASVSSGPRGIAEQINSMFDPGVTFDDLLWMRDIWPKALVVKGIQSVDDARRVVDLGADAIVLSNHGGRQLDRAPVPFELVPAVADAVGDRAEILMDTGVRSGADVVAAVASGARACLVGRAYLYGLMAGGETGVQRAADILSADVLRTMQLLGVSNVNQLDRSCLTRRP
jgi:L-lactate dehydrogenase (cytochrome)